MRILPISAPAFAAYGRVLENYDMEELTARMRAIPMPSAGTAYEPSIAALESSAAFAELRCREYGGMPIQLGMCWGYNTKLNCMEYHRDSEVNIGADAFVLLLAKSSDIADGHLNTAKVRAFRVPAHIPVEIYATTLHYAPCSPRADEGFRVAVALPRGTNMARPAFSAKTAEDRWMTACNKWLLAHPEADEAKNGAYIGLTGVNIDISQEKRG